MNNRTALRALLIVLVGILAACAGDVASESKSAPLSRATAAPSALPLGDWQSLNPFPIERGIIRYEQSAPAIRPPFQHDRQTLAITETAGAGTLVLYDDGGPWGWLGELYAIGMGTLASHFGSWTAKPVGQYIAQEISNYQAVIYVGSTFDQAVPTAFLADVVAGTRPVLWIDDNIWQLVNHYPSFASTYGFVPWVYDTSEVAEVDYKGAALSRYSASGAGIMSYSAVDTTRATVLAEARRTDGTTFPWAVRGANLTYIGENPQSYVSPNDRYLVMCDLLFDLLAPSTPDRHRALVRIEDVSPESDPSALRAIADYLSSEGVPFSVATIPVYTDPNGYYNDGVPLTVTQAGAPEVAGAINYMLSKGGTLVMHGYTHQFSTVADPYDAVTADDFEFYLTHWDADGYLSYDGPVPGDSTTWASGRITSGLGELSAANLPLPTMFEFPHYAGTPTDAAAIRATFATAYHRGMYFGGALTGQATNYTQFIGMFVPYVVNDVYGFKLIPENLGYYEPAPDHHNVIWLEPDIVGAARANLVVRDGVASFFFHPTFSVSILTTIVSGIKAAGYSFVSPNSL
jgi:uncharacterized protein YdaL